ncbi:DedD protein [Pseudomonas citronellolis]|uniref:SPOR domain-containing protein n=1 Tax=Pseudomonas citronellolis TaxID=53408 RepID=UPI00209EB1A3|nr:SPOR domain-containing protein [Pseudomonas citronellolis]MCP1642674.1 DedD protein [Pseudomonas citronellolis]MCP1665598.1 DedD protein [Pseudomonas citronellolis]MCP1696508.1 DedD protein [Pseudomonas citronellolis]MCP1703154.1 DedD protein [Pseudomonas citronellolis]MCP1797407.1 DedD protein [Pseudomonas citronellolis]
MALLDKGLKQRIVGALVLLALAVIFLPMLFSRQDEVRQVTVDAPAMPKTPVMPAVEVQPTPVPEPQAPVAEAPQDQVQAPVPSPAPTTAPSTPIASLPQTPAQQPAAPAPRPAQQPATPPAQASAPAAPAQRLDADKLAVSWSVQLASLSNRARAEELQKSLRSQGYNAYVRSFDGMNRVFVGPVIERAEADRLKEQLSKQQKLNGFVVRFQPERG